ncbi:MAG: hypothetical protein ACLRFI_01315 [Alphaproteobacteria bacterium]
MIDIENIFLVEPDICKTVSLYFGSMDETDLAGGIDVLNSNGVKNISVLPDGVKIVWPWVEKNGVNIFARFYISDIDDSSLGEFVKQVNVVFKHGATGVQIFLNVKSLEKFTNVISSVRDDLFFNKFLSVGLDVDEIDTGNYETVLNNLIKLRADSLLLVLLKDTKTKSEFVGRVYGLLNAWNTDFSGALHFMAQTNPERYIQFYRLVNSLQPQLVKNIHMFLPY